MFPNYQSAAAVTPSDSAKLTADALYIGVAGDVTVDMLKGGTNVLFKAAPVGELRIAVSRVYSTGTAAQNILALRV